MIDAIDCAWEPRKCVGPLVFGEPIPGHLLGGVLNEIDLEEAEGGIPWQTFSTADDAVDVHVDDDKVITVACYRECRLGDVDLIGLPFDEAVAAIGSGPDAGPEAIEIADGVQHVYEFDSVEAQLWVRDGTVVTVFCSQSLDG